VSAQSSRGAGQTAPPGDPRLDAPRGGCRVDLSPAPPGEATAAQESPTCLLRMPTQGLSKWTDGAPCHRSNSRADAAPRRCTRPEAATRQAPTRRRCFARHCERAARRSQRCRVGRNGAVSSRPRQAGAKPAPFRPRGQSGLARIQLAPAPPSAGNRGSDPIGRDGPTTDSAAGLATGDLRDRRR
jgi:hypothetical protein